MARGEESPIDVLIIGAGIAGASLAYFLSERGSSDVLVIERESQPGYHATGRSAATLVELDPVPTVQKLKILGAGFLRQPPAGFAHNPVLERCGVFSLLREPQWTMRKNAAAADSANEPRLELMMPGEVNQRLGGVLQEGELAGAAFLPDDGFIDIHELLTSYMRHAKRAGVEFRFGVEVTGISRERGRHLAVATTGGVLRAKRVVNAAGAWVGDIARRAGASAIEFRPMRRSIAILPAPASIDVRRWPMVVSEPHSVYFRPESGGSSSARWTRPRWRRATPLPTRSSSPRDSRGCVRSRRRSCPARSGGDGVGCEPSLPTVSRWSATILRWRDSSGSPAREVAASRPVLLSARSPPT